jgi:hypothetical protein
MRELCKSHKLASYGMIPPMMAVSRNLYGIYYKTWIAYVTDQLICGLEKWTARVYLLTEGLMKEKLVKITEA